MILKTDLFIKCIFIALTGSCGDKAPAKTSHIINDTAITVDSVVLPLPAGKIIDSVTCKADPGQSYALYIPAKGNKDTLPVIYFFDPHADGALPLNKYKSLADEYGFILVGSNNSKNGNDWATTAAIWDRLFDDTQGRLKISSNRIYTCGFSGGAKVAGYVALNHAEIKGVIANSAGLPDGVPPGNFRFSFTAIAGHGDMNMTDLVSVSKGLDNSTTRHRIILFDGKHEWAPEATMRIAFAGLQFDAIKSGLISADGLFVNTYISKSKEKTDSCFKSLELIKAMQECMISLSFLDGVSDQSNWFRDKIALLNTDPQYQKQRQAQDKILVTEENTKAAYAAHFQQDDMDYWAGTIKDLQTKAHTQSPAQQMNQRLLAYLSLAFYSISNQLINANENTGAAHFVGLYKMADPENSEAWYFSAILHARDSQAQAAGSDLLKAASCGFNDKKRMMQQPEFERLAGQINFSEIGEHMN